MLSDYIFCDLQDIIKQWSKKCHLKTHEVSLKKQNIDNQYFEFIYYHF
ncbi:hypothetical protein CLV33_11337 [Jejuia pallidilutea]|uniref:Uncharacterized protein n=1 Tax=Jejuia pallidilutea TaxID=504487 RepID=A0A362WWZ0_9FLAO|nr:hypothetical protein CLV33_11337 [Jejuia pallidilutea]